MRIQTLEYNANQPLLRQIIVPTNSNYGIGIKIFKDDEPLSCGLDEMTIDGISAISQVAGYNVYELSSGNDVGLKQHVVSVNIPSTLQDSVLTTLSGTTRTTSVMKSFPFTLSAYAELPQNFTVNAKNLKYIFNQTATLNDESVDITRNTTYAPTINISRNGSIYASGREGAGYFIIQSTGEKINSFTFDKDTDKIQIGYIAYTTTTNASYSLSCTLSIDTNDAFNSTFKLQVQTKDLGYFEK